MKHRSELEYVARNFSLFPVEVNQSLFISFISGEKVGIYYFNVPNVESRPGPPFELFCSESAEYW